jgi:hypothetical protein
MEITGVQRSQVLKEIADETVAYKKEDKKKEEATQAKGEAALKSKGTQKDNKKAYFFQLMRDLTVLGYFTSEVGATKALAYVPIPGRFDGCTDLKPGQKAWAL